jgi:hypothetical protein
MSREGRKINHGTWLVVGLVAAILLGAAIIWLTGPKLWTDDRTIRVADSGAQLRQVLWEKPRPLGPQFQSDQQQYEPSFSPDGNEFYFVRNKPGLNADIYVSYRSNNQWSAPVPLQAVNSAYDDLGPRVTADGKFLLFYSDRPGGFGGYDIWASARTDDGWGQPFNLGPQVNSEYNEFSPDPTPDGKHLIFATNRKAAAGEQKQAWRATIRQTENGDYDLWMAEPDPQAPSIPSPGTPGEGKGGGLTVDSQNPLPNPPPEYRGREKSGEPATDPSDKSAPQLVFKPAAELPGVNTPFMEGASCMSPAGDFLYFASNRPGGLGKFDLYRARVFPHDDGSWRLGAVENLGPQVNSADNETDPSLALNGFRLVFSSDRGNDSGLYHLLQSDSREVYALHQSRPLPHVGMSFWLMLTSLLVLIPLLLFLRGWDERKLGLLQKCLLLSLLVHAAICFALSFMHVSAQAFHYVRAEMGIELPVSLSAPKDVEIGYAIRRQSSNDLPVLGAMPDALPQSQTPVEMANTATRLEVNAPAAVATAGGDLVGVDPIAPAKPQAAQTLVVANAVAPQTDALDVRVGPLRSVSQQEKTLQTAPPDAQVARSVIAHSEPIEPQPTQLSTGPLTAAIPSNATSIVSASTKARVEIDSMQTPAVAAAEHPTDALSAVAPSISGIKAKTDEASPDAMLAARADQKAVASPQTLARAQASPSDIGAVVPRSSATTQPSLNSPAAAAARVAAVASSPAQVLVPGPSSAADAPPVTGIVVHEQTTPKLAQAAAVAVAPEAIAPNLKPIADSSSAKSAPGAASMQTADAPPTPALPAGKDSMIAASVAISHQTAAASPDSSSSPSAAIPNPADLPAVSLPKNAGSSRIGAIARAGNPSTKDDRPDAIAFAAPRAQHGAEGGGVRDIVVDAGNLPATHDKPTASGNGADSLEAHPHIAPVASSLVAPDVMAVIPPPGDAGPAIAAAPPSPFTMRDPEQHKPILEKLGGTKESESAVERGLTYLASVQEEDGRWTFVTGNHRPTARRHQHDPACTGLSVLAFLAQDHRPDKPGKYQETVAGALDFLVHDQLEDGDLRGPLRGGGADNGNMYDQGIATLALAEAALMTGDAKYTQAALKGAQFIVAAQNQQTGGWRYIPGEAGDSSVFGWQIMALHSAEQLGFKIPAATRRGAIRYIAMASSGEQGMLAGYQPNTSATGAMTAEIVFCRMLLGQQLTEDEAGEVSDYLGRQPPNARDPDIYYWYYGSLCMMQMQSETWKQWNTRTRDMLVRSQRKVNDKGYWDAMRWSDRGGRVFSTAMATLTLEVYYRYMPLQKK